MRKPCSHDLRPGTVTCLRCDREARLAARARFWGGLLRVAGVAGAIALLASGGKRLWDSHGHQLSWPAFPPSTAASAPSQSSTSALLVSREEYEQGEVSPEPPPPEPPKPRIRPGRTELHEGMFATRDGDVVTVHFDLIMLRTRRPEKFERIVRETLPQVFGAIADSLLAEIAPGNLVGDMDLLTEVPARGVHLPHDAGAPALSLWPQTRPGRDGPLVVAYTIIPRR